jgi:hypothetical protein
VFEGVGIKRAYKTPEKVNINKIAIIKEIDIVIEK